MSLLEYLGMKPTLPRFAGRVLKAMPSELASEWSFDAERGMLVRPDGGEMSLHNMFAEYCAQKAWHRAGLIDKYAAIAGSHLDEIPDLWVAAAKNIYPVVRSLFVDTTIEIKSRSLDQSYDPVALPFAGDLRVRVVYDFGSYVAYVKEEQLRTWGQDVDAVLARALANLGRLETPGWVDSKRGFFQLASPMSFEESMLLLDSVVRALPFAAHAVLMPCNRGILLAADGRDEAAIGAMLQAAEDFLQSAWPMSSTMVRRVEGGWEEVDPTPANANLAHGLAIRHLADNYAAQKEALDAYHQSRDEDIYVSECSVIKVDGQWQSYCVWAQGVDALLPVTDWIAVLPGDDSGEHIRVPWARVNEICEDRLGATAENPPRFRVQSFPDATQWAQLSEHAI